MRIRIAVRRPASVRDKLLKRIAAATKASPATGNEDRLSTGFALPSSSLLNRPARFSGADRRDEAAT